MTWKSGENCRITGAYRCQACHLDGRQTLKDFKENTVLPMCEVCPEKDATWRLTRPAGAS